MAAVDGAGIRQKLLVLLDNATKANQSRITPREIIKQALKDLNLQQNAAAHEHLAAREALLTCWHDLFLSGNLAWDMGENGVIGQCFVTKRGREMLKHLSRHPSNPAGYLEYLKQGATIGAITQGYVEEALMAYNACCYKAAAVMIGAANERIILDLRDAAVKALTDRGKNVPPVLKKDQFIKPVHAALKKTLEAHKSSMTNALRESFEAHWDPLVHQIRAGRNDAGHPSSLNPVTPEYVSSMMHSFQDCARLATELTDWIRGYHW
jgi:hypothetical protein